MARKTPVEHTEKLLTPDEVADLLGVSTKTLANWRSLRQGPGYIAMHGRKIRYRPEDLDMWLATQKVTAAG